MIETIDLSVNVNNIEVISNINFKIENEVLGLLGLNGSGKTTLLKTLAGVNRNYNGEILLDKKNIKLFNSSELAHIVSFLPQEHTPFFDFTLYEMVMLGRIPYFGKLGFPAKHDKAIVTSLISSIGLFDQRNKYFKELSGGEKKLVLIAMLLAQDTKVVLLDEPTASLDIYNTSLIIRKIVDLAICYKKTIIISLHDINQAISFLDSALLLYTNSEAIFGARDEVLTVTNLEKLYGIKLRTVKIDNQIYFHPEMI